MFFGRGSSLLFRVLTFPQLADQGKFRLKVHIVRQFDVLHETGRIHVIPMHEHELGVLGRTDLVFLQFPGTQGAVHDGHGQGFALVVAEDEPVTAGEAGLEGTAGVPADHVAFGELHFAQGDGKAQLFRDDGQLHETAAQFPGEGVDSAVTALGGIGHAQ